MKSFGAKSVKITSELVCLIASAAEFENTKVWDGTFLIKNTTVLNRYYPWRKVGYYHKVNRTCFSNWVYK